LQLIQGEDMATSFGKRLKELREEKGLTQEGLARAVEMSVSAVSKMEHRELDPSWSTVQKLARALGVSCEAFSDQSEEDKPRKKATTKKGGK
jgi:transcriptional regulator with XRE-family HTH domain